jgi:hypothetical protein
MPLVVGVTGLDDRGNVRVSQPLLDGRGELVCGDLGVLDVGRDRRLGSTAGEG